jgi:hypothetical protein
VDIPRQSKKSFWPNIAIVFALGTVCWGLILRFYPRLPPPLLLYPESFLKKHNLVIPALLVFAACIALHLAWSFRRVERELPGGWIRKGIIFGGMFGLLWTLGFIEYHYFWGGTLLAGFSAGIADWFGLTVFGALVAWRFTSVGGARTDGEGRAQEPPLAIAALAAIPVCYAAGRILFYRLAGFDFLHPMDAVGVGCELAIGAGIAAMFHLYRDAFRSAGRGLSLRGEAAFALLFFGANWMLFNFFPAIFWNVPLAQFAGVAVVDVVSISIGILLYKWIILYPPGVPMYTKIIKSKK